MDPSVMNVDELVIKLKNAPDDQDIFTMAVVQEMTGKLCSEFMYIFFIFNADKWKGSSDRKHMLSKVIENYQENSVAIVNLMLKMVT